MDRSTPELEFDIDVVRMPASLLLLAVVYGTLSSVTILLALSIEPTTLAAVTAAPVAPTAIIGPVAQPATQAAPVAVAAVVEVAEVEPSVVAEAPAARPLAKRRPKPRAAPKNESGGRTMMKEGAFVFERTGTPTVTEKVAVVVRVPTREAISPAFDPANIDLVMRDRATGFRSCYESALKTNPTLRASFDIRFTIGREGAVQRASVHPHRKGPVASLSRCVKTILQRTRFGISTTSTTVSRQLTFRHDDDATAPRLIVASASH